MSKKRADKQQQPELAVINDSANYDMVVRPAFPYEFEDGTVVDFTDREKYPLATDHARFAPAPRPEESEMSEPDGTATAGSQKKLLGAVKLSKPIGEMTPAELDEVAAQIAKQAEKKRRGSP